MSFSKSGFFPAETLSVSLLLSLAIFSGCAAPDLSRPDHERVATRGHWFTEVMRSPLPHVKHYGPALPYLDHRFTRSEPVATRGASEAQPPERPPLSPGDRIRLFMPMAPVLDEISRGSGDSFGGTFEIGIDGQIKIPHLPLIPAAGRTLDQLEREITNALELRQIFRPGMAHASLAHLQWAPINVFVSGAVFQPGLHTINKRAAEDQAQAKDRASGDYPLDRFLPTALRAAGGVRPDADITQIELIRDNKRYWLDLSGLVLGLHTRPIPLMDGDQVRIPSVGGPQLELVRPTAITPPGIRVFISNLTVPSTSNANSAVGDHATSLPYGTRLHNAVISGNCAGGTASTNSSRYAVLVTQDPSTQQPVTVERNVESLLRAPDRPDLNPHLMPNDSVVCYDSNVSDLRDIGRAITDILLPLSLIY